MALKKLYPKIKKGKDNLYYASVCSRNGKQIFRTGDGYTTKQGAIKAVEIFREGFVLAPTEVIK